MPERTNPRHAAFDYRTAAAYFVTICTHEHQCLFGKVRRGRMMLNDRGKIVVEEWERSEAMRDEVVLDAFVVMPNHLHGIVCIVPPDVDDVSPRGYDLDVGPHRHAALQDGDDHPRWKDGRPQRHAKSPGSMIAGFKGAVTTRINERRDTPGAPVWHADSGRHTIYEDQRNLGADNRRHGRRAGHTSVGIRGDGPKTGIIRSGDDQALEASSPGTTHET